MLVSPAAAEVFRHRLIFIRHGETPWNAEGRLQGQRETPINGRGRDQAAAAARALKAWLGAGFGDVLAKLVFYSSPLLRTRQTMDIVRATLGLPPQPYATDDRLKELSFGVWEGLTWSEVKLRAPRDYKARRDDRWGFVPPKGESYAMGATRVDAWLRTLPGDTLVVSHGGVARALMVLLAGVPTADAADAPIPQGRVMVLQDGRLDWVGD